MSFLDQNRFVSFFKGFSSPASSRCKPKVTTQYPEQKRPKPERLHGRHVLNRYEDGMEKCIGCELCAGVCPARCIYVRGADNPPDAPVSPGERYGFVYEINFLRCIHCDLCVEACPTEAITESKLFEFSFTNREDAIYTKAELSWTTPVSPNSCPGKTGNQVTTAILRPGCGPLRHQAGPTWRACRYGAASWLRRPPAQAGQSDPQAADVPADFDTSFREVEAAEVKGVGVSTVRPVRRPRAVASPDRPDRSASPVASR